MIVIKRNGTEVVFDITKIIAAITKANAVERMLRGPVSEACPCSILRTHAAAKLYLDKESASKL